MNGTSTIGSQKNLFLVRFRPDGQTDYRIGGGLGYQLTTVGANEASSSDLALGSSGEIYAAGLAVRDLSSNLAVAKLEELPLSLEAQLEWFAKDLVYDLGWKRGDQVKFGYSVDAVWQDESSGFFAFGLTRPNANSVLVFQGTDGTIADILTDADPRGIGMSQYDAAVNLVSEVDSRPNQTYVPETMSQWIGRFSSDLATRPVLTGHSLGGALAQLFASDFSRQYDLYQVVTFNSPGIPVARADAFRVERLFVRPIHYVSNGDIVSMAGWAYINGRVVLSSFGTGTLNPLEMLVRKHLAPILSNGPNGLSLPSGLLNVDIAESWLESPSFAYVDLEYMALATAIGTVAHGVDPILGSKMMFRGTMEPIRASLGPLIRAGLQEVQYVLRNDFDLRLPAVDLALLPNFGVTTQDMHFQYRRLPLPTLHIQGIGTVDFGLGEASVDFAGSNYIDVTTGGLRVVGSLEVDDIALSGGWGLSKLLLNINSVAETITGTVEVSTPANASVNGEFRLSNGRLNAIQVTVPLPFPGVPIGESGFFLTDISGGLENLVEPPKVPQLSADATVTFGPELDISLPPWLGGAKFDATLLTVDGEITLSSSLVGLNGNLRSLGGLISGDGSSSINLSKKKLTASTRFNVYGQSILDGKLNVTAGRTPSVALNVSGPITFPALMLVDQLLLGGKSLPNGKLSIRYHDNNTLYDDTLVASIKLSGLKNPIGFFGSFADQTPTFFGLEQLTARRRSIARTTNVEPSSPLTAEDSFDVPKGAPEAVFGARWTVAGSATFELETPGGIVLNEAAIASRPDIRFLDELSGDSQRFLTVDNPEAGTWKIRIVDASNLGTVDFIGLKTSIDPTLRIGSTRIEGQELVIDYLAADPDSQAKLTFFYDTDDQDFDGVPLGTVVESDQAGQFRIRTSELPTGSFHIYAELDDGSNLPFKAMPPISSRS